MREQTTYISLPTAEEDPDQEDQISQDTTTDTSLVPDSTYTASSSLSSTTEEIPTISLDTAHPPPHTPMIRLQLNDRNVVEEKDDSFLSDFFSDADNEMFNSEDKGYFSLRNSFRDSLKVGSMDGLAGLKDAKSTDSLKENNARENSGNNG